MLSTLCLAHYSDTRLPERRGELYERTLGLMIEVWTRERSGGPALRLETARLVLQPLAYAMHVQDRRELAVAEAASLIKTPLSQVPALRNVALTPERFLDLVRDECGVLASRDLGRIEFVHLSFQEYLAACHVAVRGLGRTLADRAGDPRWEEVIDDRLGDNALRAAARSLLGAPDAAAAPRQGQPFVEPETGMAFVWIPGGQFVMGSSKKLASPTSMPMPTTTSSRHTRCSSPGSG